MTTIYFSVTKSAGGELVTTPASATVLTRNTTLEFTLDSAAAKEFKLTGYTTSDTQNQLGPAKISGNGNSMNVTDSNSAAGTFNVCVTAEVRSSGQPANSDPQITNIPPD